MNSNSSSDRLSSEPSHPLCVRAIGPLLLFIVGIMLCVWTWDKGPDPVVDFGRECYVPWRLGAGDVLYRDINYFNGPLSPYFNAAIFRVFGVSIRTLKLTNVIIIA